MSSAMDEKLQGTPGVFPPYTDEEHAGASTAPVWKLKAYYQPSQQGQSISKWICYALIVGLAFYSAGFAVSRYTIGSSHERIPEPTSQEIQSPLSETSSANKTFASAESWTLYGYKDRRCMEGLKVIANGEGFKACTPVAGMNQLLSFRFVGRQELPSTGVCLYGGNCGRRNAWTSESKRFPDCVEVPTQGDADFFLVQRLSQQTGERQPCP